MAYIFIHGSGQDSSSWNETVSYMTKIKENILCPDLSLFLKGKEATYGNLYSAFAEYCNTITEPLNLCGLSLGGILALNYGIDHPEKVRTLVLICTPHKIQGFTFNIQTIIFRLLPKAFFNKLGLQKNDMFTLANSMKKLDFSNKLEKIRCPALVVCGAKDRINMKSANYLSGNIKNATIGIIKNAGHILNEENPKTLALELETFYENRTDLADCVTQSDTSPAPYF